MSSVIPRSSSAKRRRVDETATHLEISSLHALLDEILLRVFAYTERGDVAVLCRVCNRFRHVILGSAELWRELAIRSCGSVLDEVWRSLRGQVCNNDDDNEPLDDAALWRRIFVSRERACRRALEEYIDYHIVSNEGLPAFEPDAWPHWMEPLTYYSFVVHVWNTDGKKLSMTVNQAHFAGSSIRLDLGKSCVGNLIRSGKFHALEVEIGRERDGSAVSAVLYSSVNPLNVYGGGSFEEYSVMPWFEWEGDSEEYPPAYWPERYDWLPFVSVVIPPDQGSSTTVMSVEMQWRFRSATGKRGDDYEFVHWVNETEILTFFKHRSYTHESSSSKEPHCIVQSLVRAMLPTQDYTPKPLSAYSFLVELNNTKDSAKNCSIFYECISEFDVNDGLDFEIPTCYEDFFPWGEDYEHQREDDVWVDIDTVFTVYVIDRGTGMQARLYESKTSCALWEYFDLSHFVEFEKCASLTQFSNGSEVDTIPVPVTRGFVPFAWKEDLLDLGSPPSFCVRFEFLSYRARNPGTGDAVEILESSSDDLLVFLDKGLVYK